MAGKNKVSVSIALEGEQQYRQAIQNINSAQKTLRSEMKTVEQQFKTSANSLEALTSKQNVLQRQYEQQAQKVKVYEQALENATNKEATAAEKVDKLTKEYEEEQQALDKMRQTMPEATEEIAKQEQKVNDLSNKLSVAQKDYLSAQNATNKYQTSLNYANVELQDLDSELQKNDGYMREAEKSADKTAHSIDQYGNEVKEAEQDTMSFGQTALAVFAGQVLHQALEKLVRGIADISKECVEMGSQFEASMSKVEAVSGATGSDLDALTAKAKEMGSTTMFSASQAADAMNYMAMAGWKTEDMLGGIEGVMSLAAASGEDLATTSDIVTDALTAFGLTAQDAGHFADVLAAASSNANTNVSMMGETFKYCAPVAGALGFSVEDTAEAIGLMANAGIKGSQAGTSLRRIMQELNGEVKIHSKTMGDVVIQTTNADGSMRELSDILADCRVAFGELSESEKAAAASSIVGKNAMSGFLALMNAAPSDVDKLSSALNNCNGVAKDMADTMQDNLQGKITILKSALEGLAISTYDAFDDSLKEGVEGATEAIGQLNDAIVNGDLGVSLDRLGESASRLITDVVDDLVDNMPQIVDGLTDLLDNAENIGSVLITLVEAWGAYKVATTGAQAAQALLNAEMTVNPIIAVAEAVLIAGNALVAYQRNVAKAGEEQLKLNRQTTPLIAETRKLTASVNESKAAYDQSTSDMEAQGAACDRLVGELINLNAQYQDSNAPGFSEAITQQTSIINELNAAYPGLNLSINEHTGALNMSTDAIKANIEAMQSQAYAEAAQERLTEIAKQKLDIDIQREKLLPELTEKEAAFAEAKSAYASEEERLLQAQKDGTAYYENVQEDVDAAKDSFLDAGHAVSETKGEISALDQAAADLSEEEQILTQKIEENTAATTASGEAAAGATNGFEQLKMSEDELEDFVEAVNGSIESQINLFDKFNEGTKVTAQELQSNLDSQIEGLTEWEGNFSALADQIGGEGDALLEQLAKMGPQGNGYIKALLNMDDLAGYVAQYNEALQLKADATADIVNTYLDAGTNAGESFTQGIVEGYENTSSEVVEAAENTVSDAEEAATDKAKDFTKTGETSMESTKEGIESKAPEVDTAIEKVGENAVKTADNAMGKKQFVSVGENIPKGIVEGINNGKSEVITSVKTMAAEAVKAAKDELEIKSPSRKFYEIGAYSAEGYTLGFNEHSKDMLDAVSNTMNETANAAYAPVTTPSGMDSTTIAETISNAIEKGLAEFVLNVNTNVKEDSIVAVTVAANKKHQIMTGGGLYV